MARDDDRITPGWCFVHIGFESDVVDIDGVNPWTAQPWTSRRQCIVVAHPSYPRQRHDMDIYTIETAAGVVTFAAGEFSNGAWGFFARTKRRAE
jgi:hypothetical protein